MTCPASFAGLQPATWLSSFDNLVEWLVVLSVRWLVVLSVVSSVVLSAVSSGPARTDSNSTVFLDCDTLFVEHPLEQDRAEVAFAGVGQDHDDGLAGILGTFGQSDRHGDSRTAGDAGEDAFFMRQSACIQHGIFVADLFDLIHQRQVEVVRHEAGTDALDLVRAGFEWFTGALLSEDGTSRGFHGYRDDGFAFGQLDVARYAGDGAAGADPRYEYIDLAVSIVPDFWSGGLFVDGGIGRVLELLQQHVFGIGGRDLLGLGDRAAHAFGAFGQHQRGAESDQQFAPFDAPGFRHGECQRDAACGGDERQSDAGVAAGGCDDVLARAGQAAFFGICDHCGTDTAFDRVSRIAPFNLGEDGGRCAVGDAVEAYQWGVTDG